MSPSPEVHTDVPAHFSEPISTVYYLEPRPIAQYTTIVMHDHLRGWREMYPLAMWPSGPPPQCTNLGHQPLEF